MRVSRAAIMMLCLLAAPSAQTAKQIVRPLPGQTPPYSLAIKAGGTIYVAGQLPTDDKGNLVHGDIKVQARQVFDNLRAVLGKAGSSLDKVIKCGVYSNDPAHFAAINAVYARYFPVDPPARSFVCVAGWHGPFDVEIDCIAIAAAPPPR